MSYFPWFSSAFRLSLESRTVTVRNITLFSERSHRLAIYVASVGSRHLHFRRRLESCVCLFYALLLLTGGCLGSIVTGLVSVFAYPVGTSTFIYLILEPMKRARSQVSIFGYREVRGDFNT